MFFTLIGREGASKQRSGKEGRDCNSRERVVLVDGIGRVTLLCHARGEKVNLERNREPFSHSFLGYCTECIITIIRTPQEE